MNAVTKPDNKKQAPLATFRFQLEKRLSSFAEALPPQISPAHFKSVIVSAVMASPELLAADRLSLFEAALAAANDGLLPDKREGAMVIYNSKVKEGNRDVWIKKVQWMPMVRGVVTKIYNTGKVRSVSVDVVYAGDNYRYWKDDKGEHLIHEPAENPDKSIIRRVYAMVIMSDGAVFAESLDADDIEKIRKSSKSAGKGPWVDWWEEMAKKSVIRRLSKRLPMSRELAPVLDRDNYLYDIEGGNDRLAIERQPTRNLAQQLDDLAGPGGRESDAAATDHVDEIEDRRSDADRTEQEKPATTRNNADSNNDAGQPSSPSQEGDRGPGDDSSESGSHQSAEEDLNAKAYRDGREARSNGLSRKAIPAEYRKQKALTEAFLEGFDEAPDGDGE